MCNHETDKESCCGGHKGQHDHSDGGDDCCCHENEARNDCGCGHESHRVRRFYTKEEKREHLKRYKEELEKELAAVEEHLKNM